MFFSLYVWQVATLKITYCRRFAGHTDTRQQWFPVFCLSLEAKKYEHCVKVKLVLFLYDLLFTWMSSVFFTPVILTCCHRKIMSGGWGWRVVFKQSFLQHVLSCEVILSELKSKNDPIQFSNFIYPSRAIQFAASSHTDTDTTSTQAVPQGCMGNQS